MNIYDTRGWIKVVATGIWRPEQNIWRPPMPKRTRIVKAGRHFGDQLFWGISSPEYLFLELRHASPERELIQSLALCCTFFSLPVSYRFHKLRDTGKISTLVRLLETRE